MFNVDVALSRECSRERRIEPARVACRVSHIRGSITVRCHVVTVRTQLASCFLLMGDHPSGLFPRRVYTRHDVGSRGIRPVHGG
jgi:hypothetical protein